MPCVESLLRAGNHEADWTIQHVLAAAEAAVGIDSMSKLYAQMGENLTPRDLQALWTGVGDQAGWVWRG